MSNYLVGLEVFGFDKVEPAILAALVVKGLDTFFSKCNPVLFVTSHAQLTHALPAT